MARAARAASTAGADFYLITSWIAEPEYVGQTMLFSQTSAPTGWTRNTSINDYAIRIVNGTGGVSTANNGFSSIYAATRFHTSPVSTVTLTAGATTITQTYIPAHTHSYSIGGPGSLVPMAPYTTPSPFAQPATLSTYGQPGGGIGTVGSDSSHSHPAGSLTGLTVEGYLLMGIKYVDVMIATKN